MVRRLLARAVSILARVANRVASSGRVRAAIVRSFVAKVGPRVRVTSVRVRTVRRVVTSVRVRTVRRAASTVRAVPRLASRVRIATALRARGTRMTAAISPVPSIVRGRCTRSRAPRATAVTASRRRMPRRGHVPWAARVVNAAIARALSRAPISGHGRRSAPMVRRFRAIRVKPRSASCTRSTRGARSATVCSTARTLGPEPIRVTRHCCTRW